VGPGSAAVDAAVIAGVLVAVLESSEDPAALERKPWMAGKQ
jgi:hypothetical protein